MPDEKKSHFIFGVDVIKTIAVISVIGVHFSLYTSFYTTPIRDKNMFVQALIRWLFYSCVPLFLIATGYLQNRTKISKDHYSKIVRIVGPYLGISIISLIYQMAFLDNKFSIKSGIFSIFDFKADPFSWYVNMFLGLFLLLPFFNLIINSTSKRVFQVLLTVLILIAGLPAAFNPIFTMKPTYSVFYFPDFWQAIFPVVYYFFGAYIAIYKPKVNRFISAAVVLLVALIQTLFIIWSKNNWFLSDYSSLFVIIQSVFIFLTFYDIQCNNKIVCTTFRTISKLTLEIYLLSYIFTTLLFDQNKLHVINLKLAQELIFKKYFVLYIVLCFALSFLSALLFHLLYNAITYIFKKIYKKIMLKMSVDV